MSASDPTPFSTTGRRRLLSSVGSSIVAGSSNTGIGSESNEDDAPSGASGNRRQMVPVSSTRAGVEEGSEMPTTFRRTPGRATLAPQSTATLASRFARSGAGMEGHCARGRAVSPSAPAVPMGSTLNPPAVATNNTTSPITPRGATRSIGGAVAPTSMRAPTPRSSSSPANTRRPSAVAPGGASSAATATLATAASNIATIAATSTTGTARSPVTISRTTRHARDDAAPMPPASASTSAVASAGAMPSTPSLASIYQGPPHRPHQAPLTPTPPQLQAQSQTRSQLQPASQSQPHLFPIQRVSGDPTRHSGQLSCSYTPRGSVSHIRPLPPAVNTAASSTAAVTAPPATSTTASSPAASPAVAHPLSGRWVRPSLSYAPLVTRSRSAVEAADTYAASAKRRRAEHAFVNVAPTRCFNGQFRAAAAVVVHTAPSLSAHVRPTRETAEGVDSSDDDAHERMGAAMAAVAAATTAAASGSERDIQGEAGDVVAVSLATVVTANEKHTGASGSGGLRRATGCRSLGTAATAVGVGQGTWLGGTHPVGLRGTHSRAPSIASSGHAGTRRARSMGAASSNATRSTRLTLASHQRAGFRSGGAGSRRSLVSATATATRHNQAKLNRNLDMSKMHASGMHESLWVSGQDGSIEIRSMAQPGEILSVIAPNDVASGARTVVTALVQVSAIGVVVGLSDGSLRLVNAATTLIEHEERHAHASAITCLLPLTTTAASIAAAMTGASPSAQRVNDGTPTVALAVGSLDGTITLWRAATLEPLGRLHVGRRSNSDANGSSAISVTALAVLGNGRYLFSGGEDGTLRMWHVPSQSAVAITKEEQRWLQDAATAARIAKTKRQGARTRAGTRSSGGGGGVDARSKSATSEGLGGGEDMEESPLPSPQDGLLAGGGTEISPLRASTPRPGLCDRILHAARVTAGAPVVVTPRGHPSRKSSDKRDPTTRRRSHAIGLSVKNLTSALQRASEYLTAYADDANDAVGQLYHRSALDCTRPSAAANATVAALTSFSDSAAFAWPIESAHRETVTGIAVVEDTWLVSVSRDMTAKAFGLPNGVYVRTLGAQQQRRMPLTGVVYDRVQGRLWVGGADGSLMGFDMHSPEMSLVATLRPPSASFSSVYVPIQARRMPRLFLMLSPTDHHSAAHTSAEAGADENRKRQLKEGVSHAQSEAEVEQVIVASVATLDRDTLAHGPGGTFTTYRVGEPSLRELNGAIQLSKLQGETAANQRERERIAAMGTEEERELREGRRAAMTMRAAHTQRLLMFYYTAWQRFLTRRGLRSEQRVHAESRQHTMQLSLTAVYLAKWRRFCTVIRSQVHMDALAALTYRARPSQTGTVTLVRPPIASASTSSFLSATASVRASNMMVVHLQRPISRDLVVRQQRRRALQVAAESLAGCSRETIVRAHYTAWMTFTKVRQSTLAREVACNRLLLSFSGSRYSTMEYIWDAAVRRAMRSARLRRATDLMVVKEAFSLVPQLRRRYYHTWLRALIEARHDRAAREQTNTWQLVAPLSATLVRPQVLRARYFHMWQDYALNVAKSARLYEEERTLKREYLSLQCSIDDPSTVSQLRMEERELEAAIARTALERDAAMTTEKVLRQEVMSLRMAAALRVLLAGFREPATRSLRGVASTGTSGHQHAMTNVGSEAGSLRRRTSTTVRFVGSETSAASPPQVLAAPLDPVASASSILSTPQPSQPPRAWASSASSTAGDEDDFTPSMSLADQLRSVLSAVKGAALDCARDAKQITAAHALALRLPIVEPQPAAAAAMMADPLHPRTNSYDLNTSYGSLSSNSAGGACGASRAGAVPHRRQLSHSGIAGTAASLGGSATWSVTVTSSGGPAGDGANTARRVSATTRQGRGGVMESVSGKPQSASAYTNGMPPYACLADAMDDTAQRLHALLCSAAREAGVDLEGSNGLLMLSDDIEDLAESMHRVGEQGKKCAAATRASVMMPHPQPQPQLQHSTTSATSNVSASISTGLPMLANTATPAQGQIQSSPQSSQSHRDSLQRSLRWLRLVPPRTRRDAMGLALRLVAFSDSFTAHSEASVEAGGGGISTRGASVARPLPLRCLCREATAALIVRHAAALLELLQPRLWQRQRSLQQATASCAGDNTVLVPVADPHGGIGVASGFFHGGSEPAGGAETSTAAATIANTHARTDSRLFDASGASSSVEGSPRPQRPLHRNPHSHEASLPQLRLSSIALSHPQRQPAGCAAATSSSSTRPAVATSSHISRRSVAGNSTEAEGEPSATATSAAGTMASIADNSIDSGGTGEESIGLGASVRSYSAASTPRSVTPRSLTPRSLTPRSGAAGLSAAAAGSIIQRPFLGFRVNVQRDAGPATATSTGAQGRSVITVKEVVPSYIAASGDIAEGPALLAGIAVGDQLVRFAGYAVTDLAAFNAVVSRHVKPGVNLPVTLLRNGEPVNTTIHVGLKTNMA